MYKKAFKLIVLLIVLLNKLVAFIYFFFFDVLVAVTVVIAKTPYYWDTHREPLPRREYLLEKTILVLSQGAGWGHLHPILKPHLGVFV